MSTSAAAYNAPQPVAGPSMPRQSARTAKSSRRTRGSTGPAVLLGGGAGALGSASDATPRVDQHLGAPYRGLGRELHPPSQAHLYGKQSPSPTSPHFPVHFASPSPASPAFPSPVSPIFPNMYRGPSPLPSHSTTTYNHTSQPSHSSSRKSSNPNSTSSLSTAASTSSRTLKTPQSKLDHTHPSPIIVGSSSSTSQGLGESPDGQYRSPTTMPLKVSKPVAPHQHSPTPKQRTVSAPSRPMRADPPTMAQGPLPSPPVDRSPSSQARAAAHPFSVAGGSTGRSRGPPPPLNIKKKENRLSQDWVHLDIYQEETARRASITKETEKVGPTRGAPTRARLPEAKMIPMNDASPPRRPGYDRANTAPPLSPIDEPLRDRAQRQGRGSLDQLRSTSPLPLARPRQNSLSTPPAAVLEAAAQTQSTGGRIGLFRHATARTPPQLDSRRSQDALRPSLDALRSAGGSYSKKEKDSKAIAKEQHKALGVSRDEGSPSIETDRKSSGLSLKKSSGALKALFNRGASGRAKERADIPPVPIIEKDKGRRPSTAPKESSPIPFGGVSPASSADSPLDGRKVSGATTEYEPGRGSLGMDRALYPTPSLSRTHSQGSHPVMQLPTRQRLPSRNLPPQPPPSPATIATQEQEAPPRKSGSREQTAPSDESAKSSMTQLSTLAEALPTSSLPYLSPLRASFLLESSDIPADTAVSTDSDSPASFSTAPTGQTASTSSASSSSTFRPSPQESPSPLGFSPLKTSRSLHLLQLPELDLNFDFAFENIGASPSTPRRSSPRKGLNKVSPGSPTPQRSLTTRHSPRPSPKLTRRNSDRARSQSFDGTLSPDLLNSSGFDSSDINQLFASASSNSTPPLSKPLLPSPSNVPETEETNHAASVSSHHTELSSLSHARTPSNTSSTNETASPSPPKTPDDKAHDVFSPMPLLPLPGKSHNAPPSIPLPALPVVVETPVSVEVPPPVPTTALAPAAIIEELKPIKSTQPVIQAPREYKPVLARRSMIVSPDPSKTVASLASDLGRLHSRYQSTSMTVASDRAMLVRNELLPLLAEIEKHNIIKNDHATKMLQNQCFEWINEMMFELRVEQAANERGASLEGLAAVLESTAMSEEALSGDRVNSKRFTEVMIRCMSFVMSKLGAKGVFHNTLLFSGRFLAFAFFRIPHIGEQLVTVLQPPRGALMRFTRSALIDSAIPAEAQPRYPQHLAPLIFDNARSYSARLASLAPEFASEKERDTFLFTPGNWLRRWQSDDSELFPSFYRAYHRQLAVYLAPAVEYYESLNQPLPANVLLRAPGYAHLATIFAKKCHSYILGSINAVTTSSSSQSFDATETAFRGSQKPAMLETANRRLMETMITFANIRVTIPSSRGVIECDGQQLYSGMLDLWTKNLISKTSLYAPKGVFCLFDLLDGVVDPPVDHLTGARRLTETSVLDVSHLIYVIRLILTEGEHALTLVKVIAFVFTHWEVLTARHEDRKELCLDLLLGKELFERLLLFWSQSVRSYVLRLVVFRLGHLHTTKADGIAHDVEIESVRLLQTRLDRIKKRYDELEPRAPSEADEKEETYMTPFEGGSMPRSRSTITMVTDSPRPAPSNKAERLLGLGLGNVEQGGQVEEGPGASKMGKATNWLKKSFGAKKKIKGSPASSTGSSPSFSSSPKNDPSSPLLPYAKTPDLRKSPLAAPSSPVLASPVSSGESSSPTTETTRKARPPRITTSESSPVVPEPRSPGFAFEFELPTMSPRSDTFDPTPTPTPASPRRNSQPPSPRQPQSPHMSRSFSKRSSLLPPTTASVLASESPSPVRRKKGLEMEKEEKGYDVKLHAYAIRMLAELEDAQKEYDEWWAEGGIGRVDGAPPRLTVAWPFHEGED